SVVAVNDMADLETNAHLFQYDSIYGIFPSTVEVGEGILRVDGWNITILNEKDPSRLPWKNLGVDLVIESRSLPGMTTNGAIAVEWPILLPLL
ncbi:MAG: hypothetical protein O7B35_14560, partial [Deltaproteobacteria bacterium]|nr:hypothetical protein [Deltaproteobacteria bacterium]